MRMRMMSMTMMLITMRLTMMRMGTVVVMIRIMNGSDLRRNWS